MDTLARGIHYGLFDFDGALKVRFSEWGELVTFINKIGQIRAEEAKTIADYTAAQTSNKLTPNLASLVRTMMKVMSRK